jgi:hypothetical protein
MQGFDHVTKLVYRPERILTRAISPVRGEEGDRSVTPVIDFSGWSILSVELEHGKKFHGGNPEVLKIWNLLD